MNCDVWVCRHDETHEESRERIDVCYYTLEIELAIFWYIVIREVFDERDSGSRQFAAQPFAG